MFTRERERRPSLAAATHAELRAAHTLRQPIDRAMLRSLADFADDRRVELFAGDVRAVIEHLLKRQAVREAQHEEYRRFVRTAGQERSAAPQRPVGSTFGFTTAMRCVIACAIVVGARGAAWRSRRRSRR